ncbi:glycoside hydrolase family 5 protein [Macroventuria anomochaeta]|uniref:Glycoside hydrolase family 5 protein n=1 Tax=Macroventuria anomochaeta TaxID=301207 RepID=A0ACB6RHA0_9PLEO|nr:glycoside hydrolase family 5 protein [Macroventuria anomochaeta]KAF2621077.1 glycoside hydrolase family 5 protein [Macroventuria anomochaeta]
MSKGFLRVKGTQIVDSDDESVNLRGTALGGWLNMENFLVGYSGNESGVRAAMLKVMGRDDYDFFFDRWLYHFFTEKDVTFLKSLKLNCLRLPFNHRHFEDDMNPRVLKETGFKHLDRVIRLCSENQIYTVLDMHTSPGGQNQDQHCDNNTSHAALWEYKDHQDRVVWLWEQIAHRYKDNPWIAGYNLLNEPADSEGTRVANLYTRLEKSIRAVDPQHMLFIDGNTYGMEFNAFHGILPNTIYSIHDYSMMAFSIGETYRGTPQQKQKLDQQLERKCQYQHHHSLPIWNGEFGVTWATPNDENPDAVNDCRQMLMLQQLRNYEKAGIPWSMWSYKDVALMGLMHPAPNSAYQQLIAPFLERKRRTQVDWTGASEAAEIENLINPLVKWIDSVSPTATKTYPLHWSTKQHIFRNVIQTFLASSFTNEFAELFREKTRDELEELAASWSFDGCVAHDQLVELLRNKAYIPE